MVSSSAAHAQSVDVLRRFDWTTAPGGPRAALLEAADGNLYGTTQLGGAFGQGTVFRLTRGGVRTVLHTFGGSSEGAYPVARLAQGTDGSLYGVTPSGGSNSGGTAFRIAPDGSYHQLHAFGGVGDVSNPLSMLRASDGLFYGIAYTRDGRAIYRMSESGVTTVLRAFDSPTTRPQTLIQATDGALYGTTDGGVVGGDTVFRITLAGEYSTVAALPPNTDGSGFTDQFIQGFDGSFYGVTSRGSALTPGTLFRLTPSGVMTTLAVLDTALADARFYFVTGLAQRADGTFYIVVDTTQPNEGRLFSVSATGTVSLEHNFGNFCRVTGLTLATDSSLLMTAPSCTSEDRGVILTAGANTAVSTLYRFPHENDWPAVRSALVQHPDGGLYGTTCNAGVPAGTAFRSGTLFRLMPPTDLVVVHTFENVTEGLCPVGLALGGDGLLYGTTTAGGSLGGGTAYRVSPSGHLVVLHSFVPASEGSAPAASLLSASDGNFYGATTRGAANNAGSVFRMTPNGIVTVLHSFAGGTQGGGTIWPMIQARDGNIYGTTTSSAFKLTLGGAFGVLSRLLDGPLSGLIEVEDGALYGIAKVSFAWSPHNAGYSAYPFRLSKTGDLNRFSSSLAGVSTGLSNPQSGTFTVSAATGRAFVATASIMALGSGSTSFFLVSTNESFNLLTRVDAPLGPVVGPLARARDGRLYGGTLGQLVAGIVPSGGGLFRADVLAPPPSATISLTGAAIRLRWTPVAGASSYTITRTSASGARVVVSGVVGTAFVDDTVERGLRYRYVVTATTSLGLDVASNDVAGTVGRWTAADVDGDHRADIALYRPSTGYWYTRNSTAGFAVGAGPWQFPWGAPGDIPVEADFDGDGRLDPTVFRPSVGQWFILYSTRSYDRERYGFFEWGPSTDVPLAGDFDGDNKSDLVIYRPSTGYWYIRPSSTGYPLGAGSWIFQWGAAGDVPKIGDFDGDGRSDIAVYRPSTGQWFLRVSSRQYDANAFWYLPWGAAGDVPLAADFDGDGKTDVGVYRPSTGYWFLRLSARNYVASEGDWIFQWGAAGDEPKLADYDGDGRVDITVYRPQTGQWFIRYSSRGYDATQFGYFAWGATGDSTLPAN